MNKLESRPTDKHREWRLVAIDLDGTLLNCRHEISIGNAVAVREARRNGAAIVLASGRQHGNVAAFGRSLDLPTESAVISYNGALVRTIGGETLSHRPLSSLQAAEIVRFCAEQSLHLNYYWKDDLYIREETCWAEYYRQRTGTTIRVVGDLAQFDGERPTKLLIIDEPAIIDRLFHLLASRFGTLLYVTKTEDEYLEFMDKGVNKGEALLVVSDYLSVPLDLCVAFGDSYNDESLLKVAGLGVAMENARTELKAMADLIAPPCDDDGVGIVLAKLFARSVQ